MGKGDRLGDWDPRRRTAAAPHAPALGETLGQCTAAMSGTNTPASTMSKLMTCMVACVCVCGGGGSGRQRRRIMG